MVATLTASPTSVVLGQSTKITGSGFNSRQTINLYLDSTHIAKFKATKYGTFFTNVEIPTSVSAGTHIIKAKTTTGETSVTITATAIVEPPPPPPPPPPPTQKIVQFPGSGPATPAAFLTLVADNTIDVIEWAGGRYAQWYCFLDIARTRPLLVRPAQGAIVRWDGQGIGSPPWRIGWGINNGEPTFQPKLASNISFDPAGTGGEFWIENYTIGPAGLVMFRWTENMTMNGIHVVNCVGTGTPQSSHAIYTLSDGIHRGKNLKVNNWIVDGPSSRIFNGLHIYTGGKPSYDSVEAKNWKVKNLHRASYVWDNPTGVLIEGWEIADCNVTIDNSSGTAQGVVKNCHAVNSGPLTPGQGYWRAGQLIDGGGNTAA